jgi:hypothetical protein
MRQFTSVRGWVALAVAGLSVTASATLREADASEAAAEHWHFQVLLDGKPIGFHDFAVTAAGEDRAVTAHTRLEVTVLHVPVYHYEHWDQEAWHAGCLSRIDARTDDDGSPTTVHGAAEGDQFVLDAPEGAQRLAGCIGTYAYWDARLLQRERLLNPQTGHLDPVSLQALGPESPGPQSPGQEAQRLRLRTTGYAVDLWYAASGRWLGLQTRTEQGRLLRYELLR